MYIKNLIPLDHCRKLADIIRKQPIKEGDTQVYGSYTYYSLPAINTVLGLLLGRISESAQKRLLPAYSYCRIYNYGDELKPHVDREACEWSVTINLSQTDPWPIHIGTDVFDISPGDGVLYKGCEVEHWREPFRGSEHVQIFLHYVDSEGPNRGHIFDTTIKKLYSDPVNFRLLRTNENTPKIWTNENAFMPHECKSIIGEFFKKTYEKAVVGEGDLRTSLRRSLVYWIPKIQSYSWLYNRVNEMVNAANKEYYDFEIMGIDEKIQFTEYSADDKGCYGWHTDEEGTSRKLSVSIQLSDPSDYDGGKLQFGTRDDNIMEANNALGSMTVFPSYKRHQVTPVTRGTRFALVVWITGPPFR